MSWAPASSALPGSTPRRAGNGTGLPPTTACTSADRWTAIGAVYGDYLQCSDYVAERLMVLGNPNWQQYWLITRTAALVADVAESCGGRHSTPTT